MLLSQNHEIGAAEGHSVCHSDGGTYIPCSGQSDAMAMVGHSGCGGRGEGCSIAFAGAGRGARESDGWVSSRRRIFLTLRSVLVSVICRPFRPRPVKRPLRLLTLESFPNRGASRQVRAVREA